LRFCELRQRSDTVENDASIMAMDFTVKKIV